jgi:membrane-bound lytic murein transglycosylase D
LYVPKLLAIAAIIKNPHKYGVQLPPVSDQPYFMTLKLKNSVSLDQIAKTSNISADTLKTLNPDYNHNVLPGKDGYILVVPYKDAAQVKAQLADDVIT